MTQRGGICLIGGGGHAIVVAEAALAGGLGVVGYYDDREGLEIPQLGQRLGGIDDALHHRGMPVIVGVGDLGVRRSILERLEAVAVAVTHPTAWVSPSAEVGPGTLIGARCVVQGRTRLGGHAIVNTGAIVEHDCSIGENVHIGPGAILAGGVVVGDDTLLGMRSAVLPGVRIGAGCTVGAGAVVTEDVDDGVTVVGTPARAR